MLWLLAGAALLLADGRVKAEQDGDWWPIDDPSDDGGNGTTTLPPGSGPTREPRHG